MKVLTVLNPVAGGTDKEAYREEAELLFHKYGITHTYFETSGEGDEKKLARALKSEKPDRVAAFGGDGTIMLVARALTGTDIPMGIIPGGSANGLAHDLGVEQDPLEALKNILLSHAIYGLDLLEVNETHRMVHIGDAGINARIVESYCNDENRGLTTYAKYFLEELRNSEPFPVSVRMHDQSYEGEALMVAICNSRKFGTGLPLNTVSNPLDGKFEVVVLERLDALAVIKAGLSHFNEQFVDQRVSQTFSGTEADIRFSSPTLVQLDGEVIGKHESLKIRILPGAVQFITLGDNGYVLELEGEE